MLLVDLLFPTLHPLPFGRNRWKPFLASQPALGSHYSAKQKREDRPVPVCRLWLNWIPCVRPKAKAEREFILNGQYFWHQWL